MRACKWQEYGHLGAVRGRVGTAFDVNLSAMPFDELFRDKQSYSSPNRAPGSKERVKNSWQLLSRNADAAVLYRQNDTGTIRRNPLRPLPKSRVYLP